MASNYGTNFFSGNSGVQVALTDASGNAVLARGTVANKPSAVAGYAVSCIYMATDSGALYENTGTASSATFTLIDTAAASLTLPLSVADATSTTGDSFLITETTLTTGNGIRVLGTTGTLTTGGALFKADLSAAVAGNGFVAVTTGVYTGTGLLTLTANSATTGVGALITMNGLTSGTGLSIVSSSADTTARGLLTLTSSSSSATGAAGIKFTMAALSTNFRKLFYESNTGITVWMGNGTTGQGNLSGTAGDLLINGGSNKPEYCTGTTNWTALVE